jgi:hypothetical protein
LQAVVVVVEMAVLVERLAQAEQLPELALEMLLLLLLTPVQVVVAVG